MKYSKKLIVGIVIIAYLVFIGVRYNANQTAQDTGIGSEVQEELTIVTSFYPMYLHVKELTKDIPVQVINLASSQVGCLHDYQLTVQDMKTIEQADIMVINGLGAESFMSKAYEQNKDLIVINASSQLEETLEDDHDHDHEDEHEEDHDHDHDHDEEHSHESESYAHTHEGHDHNNEHIWVSVLGSIEQVKEITNELVMHQPEYEEAYRANEVRYLTALYELKTEMETELATLQGQKATLVHNSFEYLAEELGLEVVGSISGEQDEAPTAKEIEALIHTMKNNGVEVIFTEPQYKDLALVTTIANETGSIVYELDSFVTDEKVDSSQGIEYVIRMRNNIQVLKEAFK